MARRLSKLEIWEARRHLDSTKMRGHVAQREPVPHLPLDAELFRQDNLCDGRCADDEPEEEGGREGGGVVDRQDEVDEDEGEGEVEDVGWSSDDVVEEEDAGAWTWVSHVAWRSSRRSWTHSDIEAMTQPSATAHPRSASYSSTRTTPCDRLAASSLPAAAAAPVHPAAASLAASSETSPVPSLREAASPDTVDPVKARQSIASAIDVPPPSYWSKSDDEKMVRRAGRTSERTR